MTLALTAYPSSANGTSSGKSSTSPGNIFLSTYSDSNAYQRWRFIDEDGKYIESDAQLFSNGTYYINNKNSGQYLHKNGTSSTPNAVSGLISDLGNTIRWKITYIGDDNYTIQPVHSLDKYLLVNGDGELCVTNVSNSDWLIGLNLWKITIASGGGVKIQNSARDEYLTLNTSNQVVADDSEGLPGSYLYSLGVWRIANTDFYGNNYPETTSYSNELRAGFSIQNMLVDVGETLSPQITKYPTNALWASPSDFSYSNITSATISSGKFTGVTRGPEQQITVTHKVTGLKTTFKVTVNSKISTFSQKLGDLYDVAYAYKGNDQSLALELVFNFIRGQKYNTSMWVGVTGAWDTSFKNYVNQNYPDLYSYFICDSTKLKDENYIIMLPDPASSDDIDVIHMCATLNRLFYSGSTYFAGINTFGIMNNDVDALCGWAGDLQALIQNYFDYIDINNTQTTKQGVYALFYPMIGDDNYFCPHTDIITNMDSCNIFEILSSSTISNGSSLKSIFKNYYNGTAGNTASRRFTTWIGGYSETELTSKVSRYCNDHSQYFVKWPSLKYYSIYDYQQDAFAEAFVDYLLIQKGAES